MIIYGTKNFKGKSIISKNTCPNCNTSGQLVFQTAIRCFHIFWIPIFPIQKVVVSQCQHCKKVYNKSTFNSEMYSTANELKINQKYSILHFIGLIIITGLIIWAVLPETEKERQEKELKMAKQQEEFVSKLKNPTINDIFLVRYGDTTIKGKEYKKSLVLKVVKTSLDSIDFELSNFLKLDKKLGKNSYASMGITDDYFSPENKYRSIIRESKQKISKQLVLNNLTIYRIE
jgi:hypothetical protein